MAALAPAPGETVADCTIGYGGHALAFLGRIGPTGRLIGLDVDADELDRARRRLAEAGWAAGISLHRSHFGGLGKVLAAEALDGFDVIFADLGVSSMQIDNPARGFSYKYDGPLDMRMDQRLRRTAADWLAALSEEELAAALDALADEPDHRRIARAIVRERASRPITRTAQLVRVILGTLATTRRGALTAVPASAAHASSSERPDLHPAARTFQALRILVNDELKALEQLLRVAPYCLRAGGRIGVISFHSGEDRRVEESFRQGLETGLYLVVTEQPIRPGPVECRDNPRSASARFRWARKSGQ
jgi:16S rRNA (cytosine1402-N4)-methyltransferase